MLAYPGLDKVAELFGLLNEFLGFCFGDRMHQIVIDLITFSATGVKLSRQRCDSGAHGDFQRFESGQMVSRTHHAITGAGNDHLGQLQDGIVCRREPAIG
jgi:hypothetical protein